MGFRFVTFSGGSKIEKRGRASGASVVGRATGDNSVDYEPEVFAQHGFVSRPSKATRGFCLQFGNTLLSLCAYTYGIEPPANGGAVKMYSTDADGVEQGNHLIDSDGTHTINGGTDFAVRFSKLETAFNELKGKYNALVTAYNSHVHIVSGAADPSTHVVTGTAAATVSQGSSSTADISLAKVEEIKIP